MSTAISIDGQAAPLVVLQNKATANGNGVVFPAAGFQFLGVEIVESGAGTADVFFEGSYHDFADTGPTDAKSLAYIDLSVVPHALTLVNVEVTATSRKFYQIVDPAPFIRARIQDIAGGAVVNVTVFPVATSVAAVL